MDNAHCACSGKNLDRLLRPAVMAVLAAGDTHGYVLLRQLQDIPMFAHATPDASGVYKLLKTLEEEELVTSSWDLCDSGPAKRRFSLTSDGRVCLAQWAETLQEYHTQIDELLGVLEVHTAASRPSRSRRCQCGKKKEVKKEIENG